MNLKDILFPGAKKVFDLFPDLSPEVIYKTTQLNPVDPDTGESLPPVERFTSVKAIFDTFSFDRIASGQVRQGDYKVIILADLLGFVPSIDDKILHDGKVFKIFMVETDPVRLSYELGAREV